MSSRINVIHPELLAAIFSFCVTSNLVDMYRITRVCRHWHQVALAFPSLWSSITLNTETIFTTLEETIRRSKSADLNVCIGPSPYDCGRRTRFLSLVTRIVPRIRSLYAIESSDLFFRELIAPLKLPAPALTTLSLEAPWAYAAAAFIIPDDLFAGAAPNLQHLILTRCHPTFRSPLLLNLTCLTIDACPWPAARPTLTQLINVLARLPRLKELKLVRCLPICPALYSSNVPRLALPHLTNLALYAGLLDCAHVLDCLSFPPGARTDFECHTSSGGCVTDEFARFLAALHTARADGPLPRPCELRLFPAYTTFGLTVGPRRTTPLELTADPRDPTLFMRLQCVWMLSAGRVVDALIGVALGLMPLRHVELLHTGNAHLVCRDTWAELLMHLPAVRTLSYVGEAHTLFEALAEGTPGAGVLLPQLQTLSCSHVDLRLRTEDVLGILRKFLGTRRDVGYPIRELRLVKCCGLDVGVINALRELVERVEWDQAVR